MARKGGRKVGDEGGGHPQSERGCEIFWRRSPARNQPALSACVKSSLSAIALYAIWHLQEFTVGDGRRRTKRSREFANGKILDWCLVSTPFDSVYNSSLPLSSVELPFYDSTLFVISSSPLLSTSSFWCFFVFFPSLQCAASLDIVDIPVSNRLRRLIFFVSSRNWFRLRFHWFELWSLVRLQFEGRPRLSRLSW